METNNILGEKKVFLFNIYVGNIEDESVPAYIELIKEQFKDFSNLEDVLTIFVPTRESVGSDSVKRIY